MHVVIVQARNHLAAGAVDDLLMVAPGERPADLEDLPRSGPHVQARPAPDGHVPDQDRAIVDGHGASTAWVIAAWLTSQSWPDLRTACGNGAAAAGREISAHMPAMATSTSTPPPLACAFRPASAAYRPV